MNKLITIILIFAFNFANAQNIIGKWQVHLPYYQGKFVSKNNELIYCVTEDGLFTLNEEDNSISELSKINGLSDVDISAINTNQELDIVILAYENSNIDLIKGNEIINISDIKDKQIIGNKRINSILFVKDYAYLACGFGIIKLNLEKNEISETYYIGENGVQTNVSELAYDGTYLYAATEHGIFKSKEANPEIINYENWEKCNILPTSDKEFTHISVFNDKIYTLSNYSPDSTILYQVNLDFSTYNFIADNIYKKTKIKTISNELVLFVDTAMYFYNTENQNFEPFKNLFPYPAPRDIIIENNTIYIADYKRGLLKSKDSQNTKYQPNGPNSIKAFDIDIINGIVYVAKGARNSDMSGARLRAELYTYESKQWKTFNSNSINDFVCVKANPKDPKQVFVGSIGYGLTEIYDNEIVKIYDINNLAEHTLQSIIPDRNYIRIGGLAFDDDQNLWITNYGVQNHISVRKNDGTWKSFNYEEINGDHFTDLIITQSGTKWTFSPRGEGIFAFNNNGTIDDESDDLTHKFISKNINNEPLSNSIYSIAEDKDGIIWLGTSEGIVVYYNPNNVFEGHDFYASQIIIDDNGVAKHLLQTELVTTIAVDGANRKWIGTEKSGVFLLSPDGTKELEHFTEDNSVLLSNSISKIKIDGKTGIVYIATSKGLMSYKSDASESGDYFANVYAYPNPVRPDFEGNIVIKGLIEDTNVKITDIAGNFVFETTSLGGQALWNGKTLDGKRVKSGVYIIFLSNNDGTKTAITKLLFIN